MATSGSDNFSITARDICETALRKLKVVNEDVPKAFSAHLVPALKELNMLVKAWAGDGLKLWKRETLRIDLQVNKNRFSFGTYATNVYKEKTRTEVMTAGVATDTTVYVKGVSTQFTAGDVIRLHQDDGTVLDTTIASGVATSGAGVTFVLTDALTAALAVGSQVETYAVDTRIPLRINRAYRRHEGWATTSSAVSDTTIDVVSKDMFYSQNNKRSDGPIQYVWFERVLSNGYLHTYPEASNADQELYLDVDMQVEDFDSLSDNPDFPQEWYFALVYNLALVLADNYDGIDALRLQSIMSKALAFHESAKDQDEEQGSIYFYPDPRNSRR